ncbi:hypothetical protein LZ554_001979 [Drepanopeziza brunnea f. sp. 'monogermtubi']|nr:hypothetical protein LZ554_001979 [Drepanopeziza brunnea f. sp. 'monogermtubi']
MPYPLAPSTPDSIDQVTQKDRLDPVSPLFIDPRSTHPRDIPSETSLRSAASLSPLPSVSPDVIHHEASFPQNFAPEVRRGRSRGRHTLQSRNGRENESGGSIGEVMPSSAMPSNMADFFSSEVFNIVLRNPTTAHRFLRYCQGRAAGESMEFLQMVDRYYRLLDEITQTLGQIHATYTSPDAPRQINISHHHIKDLSGDIRQATQSTIPALESVFTGAQKHVEKLLASDVYPRFVKHQVTAQAIQALATQRDRFAGLGDCFCITDPKSADNPIRFASDGFVAVTGYSRRDIVPRNCRFLQGDRTDRVAVRRLRASIDACEETVELLLNYRKNGDPFWNLLYVAPLLDESGEVCFFLGGQINCSTTIHSCNDVLKVLSTNDEELDAVDAAAHTSRDKAPSVSSKTRGTGHHGPKPKSSFFKSWRQYTAARLPVASSLRVRDEAGMEGELTNRLGKLSFKTQVEAFYTAYSKYLVMTWHAATSSLNVQYYSPGVIDMLCLNLPNGTIAHIHRRDIFKVLGDFSASASSSAHRSLKQTVRAALQAGQAVSVETNLLTGFAETRSKAWFGGSAEMALKRVEERYVTHWTPLKDEDARVKWVVLLIAPKV